MRKAITWTNSGQDMCRYMVSIGVNGLILVALNLPRNHENIFKFHIIVQHRNIAEIYSQWRQEYPSIQTVDIVTADELVIQGAWY